MDKRKVFFKPILIDLKFWNSQYFFLSFQESIKKGSEVWLRFAAHLLVLNNQNCGILGDYINHLEAISIKILIQYLYFLSFFYGSKTYSFEFVVLDFSEE